MSASRRNDSRSPARALPVPTSSSYNHGQDIQDHSPGRASLTARLASPVPSQSLTSGSPQKIPGSAPVSIREPSESQAALPGLGGRQSPQLGPSDSTLAQALRSSLGRSPPRFGTPPIRQSSPTPYDARSNYGSFDPSSGVPDMAGGRSSPVRKSDPEVIKRHLVHPPSTSSLNQERDTNLIGRGRNNISTGHGRAISEARQEDDEFSSLKLQGGDTHRGIYRWQEQAEAESRGAVSGGPKRSKSVDLRRDPPEDEEFDAASIKQPQGFRRNYIRRAANVADSSRGGSSSQIPLLADTRPKPEFVARSFLEFLTLYGHFAGEELTEDDEVLGPDEYFSSDTYGETDTEAAEGGEDREYGEDSALLTPGKRRRRRKERTEGAVTPGAAAMMLLKSFVGTGVLFLPRAFYNGGMVFSNVVLLFVAGLSYYCFCLLTSTRLVQNRSFGDMGLALYGPWLKSLINGSLVLSQIGFVSAYIVFVSENLRAFFLAVSKCTWDISITWFIFIQMLIFMPISLIRQIHNLEKFVLVADALIVLGLIYLYYYDFLTLASHHWVTDISLFNNDTWTLFIGTAIFTFEGIGLIIPIQSSMRDPHKFPRVLGLVMVGITIIFTSAGAISYAAFGSRTKTVILLNMPQDNPFVQSVQFLYSVAILLSTPLQIFPAIEIAAQQCFSRSGKYNPWIKWQKNFFRFFVVAVCALIAWVGAGDLDKFVSLVGSFACIPLVYIYPPILHYKAVSRTTFRKAMDVVLCIFGFFFMAYTTGLTVASWVQGGGMKEPGYCDDR